MGYYHYPDFVEEETEAQKCAQGPEASALLESLLEMQNLKAHLWLLIQNLLF